MTLARRKSSGVTRGELQALCNGRCRWNFRGRERRYFGGLISRRTRFDSEARNQLGPLYPSKKMLLIDKHGTRAICANACGRLARAGYRPTGQWFCPDCREKIIRHALSRLKRIEGFPPVRPVTVPPELAGEVAKRWAEILRQRIAAMRAEMAV